MPEQYLADALELRPDESQSQEKAAEGVLFIVAGIGLVVDTLLILRHVDECCEESAVSVSILRLFQGEPRELHLRFRHRVFQRICLQGVFDERTLVFQNAVKVGEGLLIQRFFRNGDGKAVIRFLRFCNELVLY